MTATIESAIDRDRMLANISLYWFTGAIGSSFWPYYARQHGQPTIPEGATVNVPTAYAAFPHEIRRPPRSIAERTYTDIRRWTAMERGGHFAALEQPAALAADVAAFFLHPPRRSTRVEVGACTGKPSTSTSGWTSAAIAASACAAPPRLRRCRARRALKPKIVLSPCGAAQEVWRNGLHRRSWLILLAQSRGDRRCFLMTLKRPPLVCPTPPF